MLHDQRYQWNLLELNAAALVLRNDSAQTQTLPMSAIAGYGTTLCAPDDGAGHVDVILHNGDRILIGVPHPHDFAQALDARLG